jgi:MtaA/CmuA family methyltransferase
MTGRERVLAMLNGDTVDRLPLMPITMMFAADQIGAKYKDYATNFEVLAEGQVCTAERFGFDYVSAISDPAREAADCGAKIGYFPDQPPAIIETEALLTDKARLAQLKQPDPLGGGRMHDRVKGVALLKEKVGNELLVEGWVEGPCAQGADLRGINAIMLDFMDDESFVRDLFAFVIELELRFAKAQVEAGADLGPAIYDEYVWEFEKRLVDGIQAMGVAVRLHVCGNTKRILGGMGRLGCEIVDLDYMVPMADGRAAMGPEQVLLGNIDPVADLREATPGQVTERLAACHAACSPKFIVGAGCEVPRDTPVANVTAMCEYARTHQA